MATLRLTVDGTIANSPAGVLPLAVRREFTEALGFDVDRTTGGGAVAIPTTEVGTPRALLLTSDQAVTVALGNITLAAGGFILVYDGAPATNPPTVSNASGSTANVKGVVLGD